MINRIQAVHIYLTSAGQLPGHFSAPANAKGYRLTVLWEWTQVPTQSTLK